MIDFPSHNTEDNRVPDTCRAMFETGCYENL